MSCQRSRNKKSEQKQDFCSLFAFDQQFISSSSMRLIGVDEVGRGPLAGPVVACAVHIKEELKIPGLNDSKKLSEKKREEIFQGIVGSSAIHFCDIFIGPEVIDQLNIFQASLLAMKKAVEGLQISSAKVLVDGNKSPVFLDGLESSCIIGGDGRSQHIALASVIAKVLRDRYMKKISREYPYYKFDKNMGYATPEHLQAIEKYGPCKIHRMSFSPLKQRNELSLF